VAEKSNGVFHTDHFESLQKYKTKYMKAGNLASANAAASLIDEVATTLQPTKISSRLFDELENTKWHYKYDETIILTFDLARSGKVKADRHWIDYTWRVISSSEIIIERPKGIKMIMTFDKGIKTFQGIDWSGKKFNGAKFLK
jgi:hypothetical protein